MTLTLDDVHTAVAVHAQLAADDWWRTLPLSERQAILVLAAARRADRTLVLGQVGAAIGLSRGAMTALADRLTTAGLVRRDAYLGDRRRTTLTLTDLGYLRVAEAIDPIAA